MFNTRFAERLLHWATASLLLSLVVLAAGVLLAYGLESASMPTEVVGHWLIALGAFGVKTTYIARLAAQDELDPHPEGRGRESLPPRALVPLRVSTVDDPETRRRDSA
jgi:hypothetical protein